MLIIGCDLHTRFQQIAYLDTTTSEIVARRLLAPRLQRKGYQA
ncbi:MAG: hypothetical protein ABSF14_16715 [Terriglobia bacterium]|jgi:hypothetical protein